MGDGFGQAVGAAVVGERADLVAPLLNLRTGGIQLPHMLGDLLGLRLQALELIFRQAADFFGRLHELRGRRSAVVEDVLARGVTLKRNVSGRMKRNHSPPSRA